MFRARWWPGALPPSQPISCTRAAMAGMTSTTRVIPSPSIRPQTSAPTVQTFPPPGKSHSLTPLPRVAAREKTSLGPSRGSRSSSARASATVTRAVCRSSTGRATTSARDPLRAPRVRTPTLTGISTFAPSHRHRSQRDTASSPAAGALGPTSLESSRATACPRAPHFATRTAVLA